ncbi:outer membrane beta-barrel protein [Segetibacter koreensis]|uniref:outer membrane beta-barrel protein n=1 Tax=Segetibacter koreensis TaxID=398037 RepID=UPI000374367F|nr:outer membrane beta-barrel protein [Segetibacter koreensis]
MKKTFIAIMVMTSSITVFSQGKSSNVSHEGFYLSMATGPVFGNIHGDDNNGTTYKVNGEAFGFDLQIGGAIKPNLILHASAQNKTLVGPKINGVKLDNNHTFQENFYGVGLTKYTSDNFFLTGNVGVGHFIQTESTSNSHSDGTTSDAGFSFNIKAGKEWMVSKKWGLGGGVFYAKTTLKNKGVNYTEHWNSNRFGLYFQATLCKSK